NMADQAKAKGMQVIPDVISSALQIPAVEINARRQQGIEALKQVITKGGKVPQLHFYDEGHPAHAESLSYNELVQRHHRTIKKYHKRNKDDVLLLEKDFDAGKIQRDDLLYRHRKLGKLFEALDSNPVQTPFRKRQEWLDRVLIHKVWGYVIFFALLLVIFQAIFSWAEKPMEWIDNGMTWLGSSVNAALPEGILNDLITNGVLAGLNGVLVFIPQIAFLFFFISIMEDTGYLARVAFMMDRTMRRFGLSGKSVIPLISGTACAVPAIMSARNIEHPHSRLLTILVTPLMTCSARLPIFILLIGMLVPDSGTGIFNYQGLALLALYLLGFLAAIGGAWLLKIFIKAEGKQYFILELPVYRIPNWQNVLTNVYKKVAAFIREAGKIIIAISIILWFLASFGPGSRLENIEHAYNARIEARPDMEAQLNKEKEGKSLKDLMPE
ncbi:MAG: ferrous iron transporter B, partial [Bacteroidota bacterium]|nr:ferrous iron transporter B [Bacteroidota bacterium]